MSACIYTCMDVCRQTCTYVSIYIHITYMDAIQRCVYIGHVMPLAHACIK